MDQARARDAVFKAREELLKVYAKTEQDFKDALNDPTIPNKDRTKIKKEYAKYQLMKQKFEEKIAFDVD